MAKFLWVMVLMIVSVLNGAAANSASSNTINTMNFQRLLTGDGADEGDGIGPIKDITQDALGFIWIAGQEGVVRYDAQKYRFFHTSNARGLPDNFVYDLQLDHNGVLWLATGEGLVYFDSEIEQFISISQLTDTAPCGKITKSIAVDSKNNLYIGTDACLNILDASRTTLKAYHPHPAKTNDTLTNDVRKVFVDTLDRVWLGTYGGGLSLFTAETGTFSNWQHDPEQPNSLAANDVEAILVDQQGRVWVGTYTGGLSRMNADRNSFTNYRTIYGDNTSLGSNTVRDLLQDRHGQLWIATDHAGLTLYDEKNDNFRHARNNAYDPASLNSDQVRTIFEDHQGDLWIGAFPGGVNFFDVSKSDFTVWQHQPDNSNSVSNNGILSFLEDSQNQIWIGTEHGLNIYNKRQKEFRQFFHDPNQKNSLASNVVVAIEEDASGKFWIGTWSGGLHYFDPEYGVIKHFLPDPKDANSLASPHVWSIKKDRDHNIWVGTIEGLGLNRIAPTTHAITRFSHSSENPNTISSNDVSVLFIDSDNTLWVGTNNGLNKFNRQTQSFTRISRPAEKDFIRSLLEDRNGNLWVGTEHQGLRIIDRKSGRVIATIDKNNGLHSSTITSLQQDAQGYIWATSHHGLARISPKNHTVISFNKSDGLAGNITNRNASLYDSDHILYVGSTEGISALMPANLGQFDRPPITVVTDLKIMNRSVPINANSPLKKSILFTQSLTLEYPTPIFSFEFSALSYRSPGKNKFSYRLLGFEDDWNFAGNQSSALYTNIDPGQYTFQLRAANSDGVWNTDGPEIKIDIPPPLWRTVWAYFLYVALSISTIYAYIYRKTQRLRKDQARDKAVATELRKLDALKNAFIANTSHELRTPLNGILGTVQSMSSHNLQDEQKINAIRHSAQKLSILVDDILDFSKISSHQLTIDTYPVDINALIDKTISELKPEADQKGLLVTHKQLNRELYVLADQEKLHKVLYHLIDNAIKYTHIGSVIIGAQLEDDICHIVIQDTGIGISNDDLKNIFDAFKQIECDDNRCYAGTGLGLALTQRIVELHSGHLEVTSELDVGSIFKVKLPTCPPPKVRETPKIRETQKVPNIVKAKADPAYKILIADDEPINLMVLAGILKLKSFQVIEAESGFRALDHLRENGDIDLVILDIMMPKLSGIETCEKIRNELNMEHLPVLFLSAKPKSEIIAQGQSVGANGYLSKPVNKVELFSLIEDCLATKQ